MAKILFLTTAHPHDDDRILFHQARSLVETGHTVKICSLSSDFSGEIYGVLIESKNLLSRNVKIKIREFLRVIQRFRPDCFICSEPLAVIAASKFKPRKPILYDITEWYPSMRMVAGYKSFLKLAHALKFFLIQLYAGFLSTQFIFGEKTKMFPLYHLYPFKKKLLLPYYPNESYIFENIKKASEDQLVIFYSGLFSEEKGIGNVFRALNALKISRPDINFKLLLLGSYKTQKDELFFNNLLSQFNNFDVEVRAKVPFEKFSQAYSEADVCLDLRVQNLENHHCLPIKLFYYMASGKPVIYTDLKATRQHVDVDRFGYLVNPEKHELIAHLLAKYADDPALYTAHAANARRLYLENYHWGNIETQFIDFVNKSKL